MSVTVTVVTTANRVRRCTLDTATGTEALRHALQRGAHLFSGKPLIIGSSQQTELFAAPTIACLEVECDPASAAALTAITPPIGQNPTLYKLTATEAETPFVGGIDGEHYTARLDFYFAGGHVLATRAEGTRKMSMAERFMNLTSLFERPLIVYHLPTGGIGLMNPQAMTRSTVTPGVPELPSDALPAVPD